MAGWCQPQVSPMSGGRRADMKISIEFKPQDFWVGAYWERLGNKQHLWVCLLPMIPIHLVWEVD